MCSRMQEICGAECKYVPNFSTDHSGSVGGRRSLYRDPMKIGLECCKMCDVKLDGENGKTVFEVKKDLYAKGDDAIHGTPCRECGQNDHCSQQIKDGLLEGMPVVT